ncbi:MAG: Fic family protein [Bacilli bacterium]|nr:Fic family protein [Bacilli bacterium]
MVEFAKYVIPGTNILKNKFGITDPKELIKKEEEIILSKMKELALKTNFGNYDSKHLCDLHRYLFKDLYDFAGNYRDVVMYKGRTYYLPPQEIPKKLEEVLTKYRNLEVNPNPSFDLANHLANFYWEIIRVHPFRDGNSRTTREFLREYTLERFNYHLDYSKINKEDFKQALVEGYPGLLAMEFYKALGFDDIKKL